MMEIAQVDRTEEKRALVSMADLGVACFNESEVAAIRQRSLETSVELQSLVSLFTKTDDVQNDRQEQMCRLLIAKGVRTVEDFNPISSFLNGLYLKGLEHNRDWKNWEHIVYYDFVFKSVTIIKNNGDLIKAYKRMFPKGKRYGSQTFTTEQILIRDLGKDLMEKGNTFVGHLKRKLLKLVKHCKINLVDLKLLL